MNRVTILDTSIASKNNGDEIIMDAVRKELGTVFSSAFVSTVATHEWMFGRSHDLISHADFTIAGGSNLIGSRLWYPGKLANWKVGPHDAFAVSGVILMGVGWHSYESPPGLYSRWLLRRLLHRNVYHSVRDEYTRIRLEELGIRNVINTGCPTLWSLTPEHCSTIPTGKADRVLTTVNTNRPDRELDRKLLELLNRHYQEVWVWVQTYTDFEYCRSLGVPVKYARPNVSGLNALLDGEGGIDYVGNRLHAGIRALQKRRRTLILSIDNRAEEMGRDCRLPVVGRAEFDRLTEMIESEFETEVEVPFDRVREWKSQFSA